VNNEQEIREMTVVYFQSVSLNYSVGIEQRQQTRPVAGL
jgi:hypothetical protein